MTARGAQMRVTGEGAPWSSVALDEEIKLTACPYVGHCVCERSQSLPLVLPAIINFIVEYFLPPPICVAPPALQNAVPSILGACKRATGMFTHSQSHITTLFLRRDILTEVAAMQPGLARIVTALFPFLRAVQSHLPALFGASADCKQSILTPHHQAQMIPAAAP